MKEEWKQQHGTFFKQKKNTLLVSFRVIVLIGLILIVKDTAQYSSSQFSSLALTKDNSDIPIAEQEENNTNATALVNTNATANATSNATNVNIISTDSKVEGVRNNTNDNNNNNKKHDSGTTALNAATSTTYCESHHYKTNCLSPRTMVRKYYEMWNHTTSTIQVPEQWKYPFYEETPSSLEILASVLHGPEHEQDYRDVDDYIRHKNESPRQRVGNPTTSSVSSSSVSSSVQSMKGSSNIPTCLAPDITATRQIADEILEGTRTKLTLPIFNLGFPKVGTFFTFLHLLFLDSCISL